MNFRQHAHHLLAGRTSSSGNVLSQRVATLGHENLLDVMKINHRRALQQHDLIQPARALGLDVEATDGLAFGGVVRRRPAKHAELLVGDGQHLADLTIERQVERAVVAGEGA